jgi:4'-phosphopantetheinyl transferase EntD
VPLFYQQDINEVTRLAVWEISEPESFFSQAVPPFRAITHPQKRLQHLAGRFLLPWLFADFPHASILIADTRKPYLPNEEYHFSISHCGHHAAAIVSKDQRVGIDVEMVTERIHRIRHKFLHPEEDALVAQHPMNATTLLTLLWSAKEALFKWWGHGEIDFSEHLRILSMPDSWEGQLEALVQKQGFEQRLILHYRIEGALCLAWTYA